MANPSSSTVDLPRFSRHEERGQALTRLAPSRVAIAALNRAIAPLTQN
ncbi:hypothetical protein [Baaleninema sp.]